MHAPAGIFDSLRDRDPVQVGGYRLLARLGSGGMGEVFLSFDAAGKPVAVKVLRGEFADDRQFRSRFAHEVRSARRVRGPGVAPLVDADPDAEAPWLATEYVVGPTLAEAVELYGPLPVSSVIVLMSGIAGSLRAIHDSGIVHRDLKPANVVLGADGLRVIDFGIARAADATPLTMTGMMVGSPQYVAPEQVVGDPPTPAGDVFSLGALAHYAATGRPAFGDGPRIAVLYRIVNEQPDLAGCPRQIRSLIEACLAKDPADRPTTAEILETCTPDEPPRTASDWLPESVLHAIDAYRTALAEVDLANRPTADSAQVVESGVARGKARGKATAAAKAADRDRSDSTRTEDLTDRTGDRRPARAASRLRRNAVSVATASAVIGAAVAIALGISSVGSSSGSPAGAGGASQSGTAQAADRQPTSAASGADGGQFGGGPPVIPGLGEPLGPPPNGGPPPGGGGPPPGGSGQSSLPAPTVLWWSGTVKISSSGLWLDGRPPLDGQGHGDLREGAPAPSALLDSANPGIENIARWTGGGTPTGAECGDFALSHGSWQVHVSTGDYVCVLTAYQQVAVLRIGDIPSDDSGMVATATVWGHTPASATASATSSG